MFNALIILVILGKFKGRLGTLRHSIIPLLLVRTIIYPLSIYDIDDCLDGKDERKEKQCVYVCACVCIIEEIKTKDSNHDN